MAKRRNIGISVEVDSLTNSVVNTTTGDSFETDVLRVLSVRELKFLTQKPAWKFDWKQEFKSRDQLVFKLLLRVRNADVVHGLISLSFQADHVWVHLVEAAPFNIGKSKMYEGVAGNLFAFACKLSWEHGFEGFVAFHAKTTLVEHYKSTLGAVQIGNGPRMFIGGRAALQLIQTYYHST